ncbi:hypothetical protein KUTeg_003977 [Tegillarca granosa]|uniref:Uncharacterized protein n=1 Tax=Tegillarca granosa TaxID=220873 RepID=A0ABQ9FQA0_TEGGR|nr:hypothetical protein KUTeg_003977 [Tegillarca granosa]
MPFRQGAKVCQFFRKPLDVVSTLKMCLLSSDDASKNTGEKIFAKKRWFQLHAFLGDIGEDFGVCSYGDDIFITGGTKDLRSCLRYTARLGPLEAEDRALRWSIQTLYGGSSEFTLRYNLGTLNSVEEYDIGTDTWKQVGELKYAADSSSAALSR